MSKLSKFSIHIALALAITLSFANIAAAKLKGKLTVLHSFAGGADGANSYSTLILDAAGNLYGTTFAGGSANLGTVFKIDKKGVETVLHTFAGGSDGANPYAGLVAANGAFYGTTYHGGPDGLGTVYKITASGAESVVYSFQGINGHSDGSFPYGGLALFSDGNLYGLTVNGGSQSDTGTLYAIEPNGAETVLYQFGTHANDGTHPYSTLKEYRDPSGNDLLLGTASTGGEGGTGNVFTFQPPFVYSELFYFGNGGNSGKTPIGGAVAAPVESDTLVFATTIGGGDSGLGTIDIEQEGGGVVWSFKGIFKAKDGSFPYASMILGADGTLYGTTVHGGNSSDDGIVYNFNQTLDTGLFMEKPIYRFSGSDGSGPFGGLVEGTPGTFYGTTSSGGARNLGVVYKLVVKSK